MRRVSAWAPRASLADFPHVLIAAAQVLDGQSTRPESGRPMKGTLGPLLYWRQQKLDVVIRSPGRGEVLRDEICSWLVQGDGLSLHLLEF